MLSPHRRVSLANEKLSVRLTRHTDSVMTLSTQGGDIADLSTMGGGLVHVGTMESPIPEIER